MKTIDEIKRKIDEYLNKLEQTENPETKENFYHVIDSLLWVIDDNSGAPI